MLKSSKIIYILDNFPVHNRCHWWCKASWRIFPTRFSIHSKIRAQRTGLRRDLNPGVWGVPPTPALCQQGFLANLSPSLNQAKALISLSKRWAKTSRADVPDFKLRSWTYLSHNTPRQPYTLQREIVSTAFKPRGEKNKQKNTWISGTP